MSIESPQRRSILALGALMAASAMTSALADESAVQSEESQHMRMMTALPLDAPKVAMLIYSKMVAMDLVGPLTVFKIARFNTMLVGKSTDPAMTVEGFSVAPTHTLAQCPSDLDVLFVPGGIMGTVALMNDPDVLAFLADRGARAHWVTSVCTGGLVLAAAGLLNGYNANAFWPVADLLPLMGARHVDQRVVIDRNRMTAGGVTAGIDFALTLVAKMKGEELARRAALTIEYAPEPPFLNGTPAQAGSVRTEEMRNSRKWMDGQARLAAEAAGKRLGITVS